jgi:hypothetical protein
MKSDQRHRTSLASWLLGSSRIAALTLVTLSVVHAQAEPASRPFVDLKYDIDPSVQGCPTVLEFRAIVARELGYDPHLAGAPIGLSVRVRLNEARLDASIDWTVDAKAKIGERRFTARAEECRAMLTTVGFVAAVQIQLMANEETAELPPLRPAAPKDDLPANTGNNSPATDRSFPPRVTMRMQSLELHPPSTSKTSAWMGSLGAGPAVAVGLGPRSVGLGRVFGAVQYAWFALELGGEVSLPSTTRQAYGGGFRHQVMLGTLAGCVWLGQASACALGKLGRIQAHGVGVDVALSPKGLLAEVGPRFGYALGLGQHWALLAHLDALYTLTSWNVFVNHVDVWTMPRFAAETGIDLMVRFR